MFLSPAAPPPSIGCPAPALRRCCGKQGCSFQWSSPTKSPVSLGVSQTNRDPSLFFLLVSVDLDLSIHSLFVRSSRLFSLPSAPACRVLLLFFLFRQLPPTYPFLYTPRRLDPSLGHHLQLQSRNSRRFWEYYFEGVPLYLYLIIAQRGTVPLVCIPTFVRYSSSPHNLLREAFCSIGVTFGRIITSILLRTTPSTVSVLRLGKPFA